jgi:hypothetical protein
MLVSMTSLFTRRGFFTLLTIVLSLQFLSCESGLEPISSTATYMRGTISYTGDSTTFPRKDSLLDLRVVAFREIPRDTNVLLTILSGNAVFTSQSLLDLTSYNLDIVIPDSLANNGVTYKYICVAQRYGANINSDWRVVSIYSTTGNNEPASINFKRGTQRSNVNFTIDWRKIPPQPFNR